MRLRLFATALLLSSVSTPALAGRGATKESLQQAIASNSPDSIVAEVERAEKLVCLSCIAIVLPLVDHDNARVRNVAAWWLNKRGVRDEVRDMAYVRLQGNDATLARNAAEALGTMRHPEAVPALSAYLAHPLDGASGVAAAKALGDIGHPSAVPALKGAALGSARPEVRAAAAAAMREIRGGTDTSVLIPLLTDPNEQVRTQAIYTIGALGEKGAVSGLMTVLGTDASPSVRKHAAWALGQIGDLTAVSALNQAVADPDPLVASVARASLQRLR
jgi:HEAT repeat protein